MEDGVASGAGGGWRGTVRTALREGLGLVLPVECVGCGQWDVAVCAVCARLLDGHPERCDADAPMLAGVGGAVLPTWSLAAYAGPVRDVVLGWKSRGRADVAPVVLAAGRRAGTAWAREPDLDLAGAADVVVVPAPSGLGRRMRRQLVVADLADAVAEGVAVALPGPAGRQVLVVDVLRRRGGLAHQSGLGARGRARNRRGTVRLLAVPPPGAAVLLVDDVVTTGATLAECARVLSGAGCRVSGALVLASTPAAGRTARRSNGSVPDLRRDTCAPATHRDVGPGLLD